MSDQCRLSPALSPGFSIFSSGSSVLRPTGIGRAAAQNVPFGDDASADVAAFHIAARLYASVDIALAFHRVAGAYAAFHHAAGHDPPAFTSPSTLPQFTPPPAFTSHSTLPQFTPPPASTTPSTLPQFTPPPAST